jgi:Spy/CpxP family protein refolding chaperone
MVGYELKGAGIVKTRIAILIGVIALITGVVAFAAAQVGQEEGQRRTRHDGPPPPPPFGVPDVEHLTKALGLSEAQANELKPFLESERATLDSLMQKAGDTHRQIMEATRDGKFDEAQVRALANQHAAAQADLIVEQERVKAKIYNTLTAEQRTKAEQLHRHGPHGEPGRPGMPPAPPPRPDDN